MMMSLLACCHLLHLRKKRNRWWWAKRLVVIFCIWGKNQETCFLPTFFNYSLCVHRIRLRDEDELRGLSWSLAT
jgi:hypothetical protein